jgi:hypothetical protein
MCTLEANKDQGSTNRKYKAVSFLETLWYPHTLQIKYCMWYIQHKYLPDGECMLQIINITRCIGSALLIHFIYSNLL